MAFRKKKKQTPPKPEEVDAAASELLHEPLGQSEALPEQEIQDNGNGIKDNGAAPEQAVQKPESGIKEQRAAEKSTPKPKGARKGLGEELMEVYESSGDQLTSVTTLDHKRRNWQRMLIWALFFLIAVSAGVAAVSWYLWGGGAKFTGEDVRLSIEAPQEAHSGDMITYLVEYENGEGTGFRRSEIEIRFPQGFIFEKAEPAPSTADNLWDLGALSAGQKGFITIEGRLVAKPDVDATVSGVFRYWPANFSSEFQEVASAQIQMLPVQLEMRLDGPEQIFVGQRSTYSILLTNETEDDLLDLKLLPLLPDSFEIEGQTPETEEADQAWVIASIKAGEEKEYQIDGYFAQSSEDDLQISASLLQKGNDDDYFEQFIKKSDIRVIEGDLVVNAIVNGSSRDTTVQWGETLTVNVSFQNNSEADLGDITALVTMGTRYRSREAETSQVGAIDWASLADPNRGSLKQVDSDEANVLHQRRITWTAEDIDQFESLGPDEEGNLDFQVNLIDAEKAKTNLSFPEEVEVFLLVQMTVGQAGQVDEGLEVTGNPIVLGIDSDLAFAAEARYYNDKGEQLGDGPLPPQVGSKTTYRIIWTLSNSIHEVQDLIVSTELPSQVAWDNSYDVSAGEVEFDATSSLLTWRLNRLPLDVSQAQLGFDVVFNPSTSQVGEIANLTRKMTMTAKDSVTGGKIIQSVQPLNTGVENDEKAADKGVVTE